MDLRLVNVVSFISMAVAAFPYNLSTTPNQTEAIFSTNSSFKEDIVNEKKQFIDSTTQTSVMMSSSMDLAEVENISRILIAQFMMQQHLEHDNLTEGNTSLTAFLQSSNATINRTASPTRGLMADRALEVIQQALTPPRNDGGFFFESPKGAWILADVIISLLAILANIVFADAIRNIKLDLKGYRHFLINLSITDIFTAIICLANFTHQAISNHTQSLLIQKCGTNFLRSLNIAGLLSNLLSLFGMSIDHYIGVFHPLRYQQIMGNARVVNCAIILTWVVSLLSAVVDSLVLLGFYFMGNESSARRGALNTVQQLHHTSTSVTLSFLTASTPPSVLNSSSDAIASRVLSMIPLLDHDLSHFHDLESSSAEDNFSLHANTSDYQDSTTTTQKPSDWLMTMPRDKDYSLQNGGEAENFDPVEEIMKFVLPNDSSVLEDFIKRLPYKVTMKDSEPHMLGWCSYHAAEKLWFELFVIGLTVLIFSILIPIYCRILRQVMLTRAEFNTRKLIVTTLLLLGAFLLCRVPFVLFEVLMVVLMRLGYMRTSGSHLRMMDINNVLNTMLMFFPLLDPIIYTIRMRAVQRYLLWRYGKCCPSVLWYCFRSEIPDSHAAKRFSTFTYAMSRGSFSGVSGYGPSAAQLLSSGNRQPLLSVTSTTSVRPPHSQSMTSHLGSLGSTSSRKPLLGRLLPRQFTLFFWSRRYRFRKGSLRRNKKTLGNSSTDRSSTNNGVRRLLTSSWLSSSHCNISRHDETIERHHASRKKDSIDCEIASLPQVLNTIIVEETVLVESSTEPASLQSSSFDQISTNDDSPFNSPPSEMMISKLNNYLTKASANFDLNCDKDGFDYSMESGDDLSNRGSFYEKVMGAVRRLKANADTPSGGDLENLLTIPMAAFQPSRSLLRSRDRIDECACGCEELHDVLECSPDDGLILHNVAPSPHLFAKNQFNNTSSYHSNHIYQQRNHSTKKVLLSNSVIFNKLAAHTKHLFELETRMLNNMAFTATSNC